MNRVQLSGRLTRDPEYKQTRDGNNTARFTVAIDRSRKSDETDYINCMAFGKTADFVARFFVKGKPIEISGRLRTTSWTDDNGKVRHGMDVVAEHCDFAVGDKPGQADTSKKERDRDTFTRADFPGLDQAEGPRAYFAGYRQRD